MAVEGEFQQLRDDIRLLNEAKRALEKEITDRALKDALQYAGIISRRLKEASRHLGVTPSSVSIELFGVTVSWTI